MNLRLLLFAFFLLCVTVVLSADDANETGETVQITGLVRLVGSSLFSDIVISASARDHWYVPGEGRKLLHDLQQRTVTVEGEEVLVELSLAGGRRKLTRRELHNIRIISIQE